MVTKVHLLPYCQAQFFDLGLYNRLQSACGLQSIFEDECFKHKGHEYAEITTKVLEVVEISIGNKSFQSEKNQEYFLFKFLVRFLEQNWTWGLEFLGVIDTENEILS